MKSVLIACFLFVWSFSFSQKINRKVDKLSGDTSLFTELEKISAKPFEVLSFSISKNKTSLFLALRPLTASKRFYNVEEGQKLFIKFESGGIDTLISPQYYSSEALDKDVSAAIVLYPIKDNDRLLLSQNKVVFIRVETSKGWLEYDVKEKNSNDIMRALNML